MKSVIFHHDKGIFILGLFFAILLIANSSVYAEWTVVNPPLVSSEWDLSGVYFTSPNEGWAVGADYFNNMVILLHYLNGSWSSVNPPIIGYVFAPELSGVHFTSPDEGWAVGTIYTSSFNCHGVLLHYHDGSWTSVTPPPFAVVGASFAGLYSVYKKHLLNTAQLCWADENRFAKR